MKVLVLGRRQLLLLLVCCLAVLAIPLLHRGISGEAVAASAANTNWGLSFREKGKTPVGNASAEFLKQYGAYFAGDPGKKVIYLTFDAGYENGNTAAILDALKKHGVKAAFFVVGNFVRNNPELVRRMAEEGHIVGNHTDTHPDMSKLSDPAAFRQELEALASAYREATGKELPRFYRPPQGKYSEQNLKNAQSLGYRTIFWSLAYVDWYEKKQPTHEEALSKLTERIHPGAVVLLHSTSRTNAEILGELLTRWESMGYTFGTLPELCGGKN